MHRKTIAEHAMDVLRETDNPAVMWGDVGLLGMIAHRAGVKDNPRLAKWHGSQMADVHSRILRALERSPLFVKSYTTIGSGRLVRVFRTLEPPTAAPRQE